MRNQKLISALQVVILRLENGIIHYNWNRAEDCNCGVVAQAIMGGRAELHEKLSMFKEQYKLNPRTMFWGNMAAAACPITGIPENEVFKALYEVGLTANEITELEYLSNPQILKRLRKNDGFSGAIRYIIGKPPLENYNDKPSLIKYLKAWVDILKEEPEGTMPVQSQLVYAPIPEIRPISIISDEELENRGPVNNDDMVEFGPIQLSKEERRRLRQEMRAARAARAEERREIFKQRLTAIDDNGLSVAFSNEVTSEIFDDLLVRGNEDEAQLRHILKCLKASLKMHEERGLINLEGTDFEICIKRRDQIADIEQRLNKVKAG